MLLTIGSFSIPFKDILVISVWNLKEIKRVSWVLKSKVDAKAYLLILNS